MSDHGENTPLRGRLAKGGEEALGKFAQDLLENPLVNSAIARAFDAREKASQAQEVAFGALNIPSAADLERLTRRVRSVSQRLEGIEDGVDRLDDRLASLGSGGVEQRLSSIETTLADLGKELTAIRKAVGETKPAAKKPAARRKPAARKKAPASAKPAQG